MTEFQQMTGRRSAGPAAITPYGCAAAFLDARDAHIRQWKALDAQLVQRLGERDKILCFGAGETSDVHKAVAPRTWEKIDAHVVDAVHPARRETTYKDKRLYYMDDPEIRQYDTVLLGTKPHYHQMLHSRLGGSFAHVIRWDDLIDNRVEEVCEPV